MLYKIFQGNLYLWNQGFFQVRIDDDKWHTLTIFQSWENVKLELDYTLVFKILNQRSFVFGNILKNSDVFIGGLPPVRLIM